MDTTKVFKFVDEVWEKDLVPQLVDYIRIPCKSPDFDPEWKEAGHMQRAVEMIREWCERQPIEGMTVEVLELPGRTPLLFVEIPGERDDCVLFHGHLDKQPEMAGWSENLGPWRPVRRGDRLYGRGSADDGYAVYAALTAIRAVREGGGKHARCVILIEASEESGSRDLPAYIDQLQGRIGEPSLVVCLESGCGNYKQLWNMTSLRGLVSGELRVDVLDAGVHSGDASGVVPSSFRIFRELVDRLEDSATGEVLHEAFQAKVPKRRRKQAAVAAEVLGKKLWRRFPLVKGCKPMSKNRTELVLNRTWRPWLEVTGMDGVPRVAEAGSVLRSFTSGKLSMRVPPTADVAKCAKVMRKVLTKKPPYGAKVTFRACETAQGWEAPAMESWLRKACAIASNAFFGRPCVSMGTGGSIALMNLLQRRFPKAQFLITGVLGPKSNAHGPDEFLHLPMVKRLTACVAVVLEKHCVRECDGEPFCVIADSDAEVVEMTQAEKKGKRKKKDKKRRRKERDKKDKKGEKDKKGKKKGKKPAEKPDEKAAKKRKNKKGKGRK